MDRPMELSPIARDALKTLDNVRIEDGVNLSVAGRVGEDVMLALR